MSAATTPLMRCGHAANAICDGKPVCAICYGLTPDAEIPADTVVSEGRKARCPYCGRETESKTTLAFFRYQPDEECDTYYCGCLGWD